MYKFIKSCYLDILIINIFLFYGKRFGCFKKNIGNGFIVLIFLVNICSIYLIII